MENLSAHTESFCKSGSAHGHNHKLLEVDIVVGVRATVEDVHHRDGQDMAVAATNVAIKFLTGLLSGGLGAGEGNAEDGVGTEIALVGSGIQFNHTGINGSLVGNFHSHNLFSDILVDMVHSLQNTFAEEYGFITVAEFHRFVNTSGSAGGDSSAAHCTSLGININFDSRIASRIEDLTTKNSNNLTHNQLIYVGL